MLLGSITTSIYSSSSCSWRFTSTTMPIVVTILLGMSSINLSTCSRPTTSWSSSTPKYITAPCAFANPQIHSKYLSCQLLLYSTFWHSLAFIFPISYFFIYKDTINCEPVATWFQLLLFLVSFVLIQ